MAAPLIGEVPPPSIVAPTAAAPATADPPVASLAEFWNIPEAERDRPRTVSLELVALYYDESWKLLWASDGVTDSYVPLASATPRLKSGDRFQFSGEVVPRQGLPLATGRMTLLPRGAPLSPLPTSGQFANGARFNGRYVTVEGFVNSQAEVGGNHLQLDLAVEGYPATARVQIADNSPIPQIQNAFVRLTGVYVADNGPSIHPNLWIPSADHVQVLGWLDRDARFDLPLTPMDQLATGRSLVHVAGTLVSQQVGESVVLRDHTGQVTVESVQLHSFPPGTRLEAVGVPVTQGFISTLKTGFFRAFARDLPAAETARGLPLLRLVEQIRALDRAAADLGYAARLHAAVTWSHPASRTLYVMDASGGLAVTLPAGFGEPPPPGSRLKITGRSRAGGFAPAVEASAIEVLDGLILPPGRPTTLEQALTGIEEGQWVSLGGYVRTVERGSPWQRLGVTSSAGEFTVVLPDTVPTPALAGAVVQFRGVCRAVTDDQQQLTGLELWAAGPEDIRIDEPAPADPFAAPLRTIASLRQFNALDAFNHRVRVAGTVVHQEDGVFLNLQDGTQTLLVLSRSTTPLQPGDRVEAVGFAGRQGRRIVLRESIYRATAHDRDPTPLALDAPADLRPALDGRLVRVQAVVADVTRRPPELHLTCQAAGLVFEAIATPREAVGLVLPPLGSRVELTGVYELQFDRNAQPRSFDLQLRSPRDVRVVAAPPWWTGPRARAVCAGLLLVTALGFAWVVSLRRRVERQTRQIREQLEQAARLEAELARSSRLESLGVLAGGIAHDFNNLLTVVLGNVSLVRLGDRRLPPEDDRCLRESEQAALRARDLTQQLLTFAKGGDPVRRAVDLPGIAREAASFALHGSPVRCDFQFSDTLWPAHVDAGQISQVMHNIILNALHAMPAGGVITIRLRNAAITAAHALPLQPGRYLELVISDRGSGIPPDHLPRIFDPYFTTKQQGSGLGLATVHSIVKKHAGHISVESTVGTGTTFTLWLPAAEAAPVPPAPTELPPVRLAGRVLFMDDEKTVRELGVAMLRRLGLEVTAVTDGEAALLECRRARDAGRPYALAILDLTVPGAMGGKDAAAGLRRLAPELRLIVSSGYSHDPVMSRHHDYGFAGRVPKPYVFEQLAQAVAAALADAAPSRG